MQTVIRRKSNWKLGKKNTSLRLTQRKERFIIREFLKNSLSSAAEISTEFIENFSTLATFETAWREPTSAELHRGSIERDYFVIVKNLQKLIFNRF